MKRNDPKNLLSETLNELMIQGNWDSARTLLEQYSKEEPNNHWILINTAIVHYETGQYTKALKLAQKAFKIEPNDPMVIDYYGIILFSNNKVSDAIEIWKKILDYSFDEIAFGQFGEGKKWAKSLITDLHYKLGTAYRKLNDTKQARKFLTQHLKSRTRGVASLYNKQDVEQQLLELKGK